MPPTSTVNTTTSTTTVTTTTTPTTKIAITTTGSHNDDTDGTISNTEIPAFLKAEKDVVSWCSTGFIVKGVELDTDLKLLPSKNLGNANGIKDCVRKCCGLADCTVAYQEDDKCYAIRCLNSTLCKAKVSKTTQSLAYVVRNGWSLFPKQEDALSSAIIINDHSVNSTITNEEPLKTDKNNNNSETIVTTTTTEKPKILEKQTKTNEKQTKMTNNKHNQHIQDEKEQDEEFCTINGTLTDNRFVAGMKAGIFTDQGDVGPDGLKNCIKFCCLDKLCDIAYMVETKCFTVQCFNELSCRTFPTPNFFLNPVIAKIRRKKPSKNLLLTSDSIPSLIYSHNFTVKNENNNQNNVSGQKSKEMSPGTEENIVRVKDKLENATFTKEKMNNTRGEKKDAGINTRNNHQTNNSSEEDGSGNEFSSMLDGSGDYNITLTLNNVSRGDNNNTMSDVEGEKYYFPLNDVDIKTIQSLSSDKGWSFLIYILPHKNKMKESR